MDLTLGHVAAAAYAAIGAQFALSAFRSRDGLLGFWKVHDRHHRLSRRTRYVLAGVALLIIAIAWLPIMIAGFVAGMISEWEKRR